MVPHTKSLDSLESDCYRSSTSNPSMMAGSLRFLFTPSMMSCEISK